jgi:hypothetical protein
MRGIIAVIVGVLSVNMALPARGASFPQERTASVSSAGQEPAAAHAKIYVFTEGASGNGAIPGDYQDRLNAMKDVLKTMARQRLPVAASWADADVLLKITGREQTTGDATIREVFADVLLLGQTLDVIGHAEGGNWQAAADDLVKRLDAFIRSYEPQILAARDADGRSDPTSAVPIGPSLHISNPRGDRIPLFVSNVGSADGFTDPSRDRQDSAKDLLRSLRMSSYIRLVDREQDAVIIVEVLGRETTREVNGWTAFTGYAQNKSHLAVRLTAGEFSTDFSADGGSSGMSTAYARAAGRVAEQIVDWVKANQQRLTERLQQKSEK